MADTTDADVAAAVTACNAATLKVQTALDTIRANNHPVRVYRARMQNAALAVANKTERGKPAAPQG
jgi:hypothetical protein